MAKNTQFVANAFRFDPYKNFKFIVKFDGKAVAGVSKVSLLKQSTEPVMHREGGDASTSRATPSVWKYEPITLERGVTHDQDFENWAKLVWSYDGDSSMSLENFRKDITIELHNEQGTAVKVYHVTRCWVSEYQALPELDSNTHVIAIEKIVLQNEGWYRDTDKVEPKEY
jgi:phage tail-like protein